MATHDVIVVGVDGSRGSEAAIRFATSEATRHGGRVELVHVLPAYIPMSPMLPVVPEDLRDVGHRILAEAREIALEGTDRVSTTLLDGPRFLTLLDASRGARMIVLGNEHRPALVRLFTGSTVAGVAAHAECPVVVVSPEWRPGPERGRVVAGVKSPLHSAALVRAAVEVAAARGAHLDLVHSWELPPQYDDLITTRVDQDEFSKQAKAEIEQTLAGMHDVTGAVVIGVEVVHGQPSRVLRDASGVADLLVVARRSHAFPVGHLGGTARALLRESRCPVMVLPPAA